MIISLLWLLYTDNPWQPLTSVHPFCLQPWLVKPEASLSLWMRMCTWKKLLFGIGEPVKHKFKKHRITIFYQTYEPETQGKNKDNAQRRAEM